jgi:hypothetical protein
MEKRKMNKIYLRLDAFDLGQIMGAMNANMENITPRLRKRIKKAATQIYIDSGYTEKQISSNVIPDEDIIRKDV